MKKMMRILSILLSLILFLSQLPLSATAESALGGGDDEEEIQYPEELKVGHPTAMRGDFSFDMFGNGTSDIDVRALIHGYNLVNWDQNQGVYAIDDSVVVDTLVTNDGEGNRSYFLSLQDDLYYSDGTQITAWDYAFSILLSIAPEINLIGGQAAKAEHILGYKDYISGAAPTLKGVEVVSDLQLVITLDHEFLPYFFETGLLLCVPYPISVIAPGCKVYDDGEGVYIGNADKSNPTPVFTADLLRETILDPETGYNTYPSVCSGPYVLTDFDGETAHFEINPYFKGTADGVMPTIEKISFTLAENETLIQQLQNGELHLVNKVVYGPTILDGMLNGGEDLRYINYPRVGLMFLAFTYDWPTVQEQEVRQAIAWCMDREQITQDYCSGFGMVVNGYYGMEQWEYLLVTGGTDYPIQNDENNPISDAEYEAEVEKWEALSLDNLTVYEVDTDRANILLDQAGWTLNKAGETYRPGTDDVRCKLIDGDLVALELKLMYPAGNRIADSLQANFIDHLTACGIRLTLVPTEMQQLLSSFSGETERTTDMICLATNFNVVVDPAIEFSIDDSDGLIAWKNTYSDDEELYRLAVDMRRTQPGEIYEYVEKWIRFQERFNQVLPTIPIYSNIYFDFYTAMLQNYYVTGHVTWTQAILEAYFGSEEDEDEWGEDEIEDDTVEFFDW